MSYSASQSNTYSEARAEHVMGKVFEDFTALIVRDFATQTQVESWKTDLLYLMKEEVLVFFEIQLHRPDDSSVALRYNVKADNTISQDASSGKLGLYSLPSGTKAGLLVDLNPLSPNYASVHMELHNNRGWGYGSQTQGDVTLQHSYSKDGFGVDRNKIGNW